MKGFRLTMRVTIVIVVALVTVTTLSWTTTGALSTPTPSQQDTIPLWQPLPEPLDLDIGGHVFRVPEGATAVPRTLAQPPIDIASGQLSAPALLHDKFWIISRGESSVKIDSESGHILEVNVIPTDVHDFASFLISQED